MQITDSFLNTFFKQFAVHCTFCFQINDSRVKFVFILLQTTIVKVNSAVERMRNEKGFTVRSKVDSVNWILKETRSAQLHINIQTIKVSALQTVYTAFMRQDRHIGKNNCSRLKLFFPFSY